MTALAEADCMTVPRIARRKPLSARIGVFGVGYHAYWPQFPGLYEELMGKLTTFVELVQAHGVEIVNFGMIDDAESAYAVLPRLKAADLDLVFCDMLTYATSASFAAIALGASSPAASRGHGLRACHHVHATVQR
jgi:L-arabinose isomerase